MKNLLYKEYKLCFPATILFFIPFVFMLLIPSYPYLVAFFFICNSIFYAFSQATVDNDLLFTALLPVSKADAVRGKYLFVVTLQAAFFALFIPLVFLTHAIHPEGNNAGVDASLTFLGEGLIVFMIFNAVFIPKFFKDAHKVGQNFLVSVIAMFSWITVAEGFMIAAKAAAAHVPFFAWVNSNLASFPAADDGTAWIVQGAFFALCLLVYAGGTCLSCRRAIRIFEKVNL